MKKCYKFSGAIIFIIILCFGCKKKDSSQSPKVKAPPDLSNFWVTAPTSYVLGDRTNIFINSSSLPSGTYKVNYRWQNSSLISEHQNEATVTMNNNIGSFETAELTWTDLSYFTIDLITNSDGLSTAPPYNNTALLHDSTGLMTAYATGEADFRAVNVKCNISGSHLGIRADIYVQHYGPFDDEMLTLDISNYTYTTGTFAFSGYSQSVRGCMFPTAKAQLVANYGQVTITSTSPLLTGSFTADCGNSITINGTFSVPAP